MRITSAGSVIALLLSWSGVAHSGFKSLQIAGSDSLIRHGSEGAIADGGGEALERQVRDSATLLFGGGSNDIQRDIIGFHGLGLPR